MVDPQHNLIVVPAGAPAWVTADLLAETIRVWQPYYAEPLTVDDALDMMQAAGQLFAVFRQEEQRHETVCRARTGQ